MKTSSSIRSMMLLIVMALPAYPLAVERPAGNTPEGQHDVALAEETSATQWKPSGLASPRNGVVFRPSPDGSLRTSRDAKKGGNGTEAAADQTAILRAQGMPDHLHVFYDPRLNGFYIASKPEASDAAATPADPTPPNPPAPMPIVETPPVPNLVISEFFVAVAKLVDATKRTIALPSGALTAVPLELWQPNKLLNTTEGPVQLPASLEPAAQPNLISLDELPTPLPLPKAGWKNGNAVSRVGSQLTIVRDNKVMTRNKLFGGPANWVDWCNIASEPDRNAGVIPPGYKWVPTKEGRAIAVPMKEDAP
ncbi:MAG: hypothetical protein JNM99_03640 [Verrucomicrobiaceae bacterium]|nr:hypothetical protein [Verrucomicrobiaceae bacterium]